MSRDLIMAHLRAHIRTVVPIGGRDRRALRAMFLVFDPTLVKGIPNAPHGRDTGNDPFLGLIFWGTEHHPPHVACSSASEASAAFSDCPERMRCRVSMSLLPAPPHLWPGIWGPATAEGLAGNAAAR